MRKVIALPLVLASFASIAGGALSSEVQPYPEYLAAYVRTLITASCEQTLKEGSEDELIKQATQGMKKDTPSYYEIHDSLIMGAAAGHALKEKGKIITKTDKIVIDRCQGVAADIAM